jgi:hypothetical protein
MTPILTRRECRKYSLSSAIQNATKTAAPAPDNRSYKERMYPDFTASASKAPAEGMEADASRAAREQFGADLSFGPDGIVIPPEVLVGDDSARVLNPAAMQRTLAVSDYPAGGALVGEEHEPIFTRYLFPASIVFGLGANFLGGLSVPKTAGTGQVSVPRITGASEGQWLSEHEAANTNRDVTAALASATPRRVVATLIVSNQLLTQTSPQGEATLWRVLMAAVAAAVDRAALAGDGGKTPLGLLNAPGVTTVSLGADGAAPTLAKLNEIEAAPLGGNVPLWAGGYAVSVNARTKMKAVQKAAGTSSFLLETTNGRDFTNGFRSYGTSLLPDTLTKGSGSNLGSLVFGAEWANLNVCQWAGMHLVSDPYTYALANRTLLTATLYLDVVTPAPQAFARCVDVVTA